MDSERGGPVAGFFWAVGAVILFFGLLAVACGACTDNDNRSLGRLQLVSHRGDDNGGEYGNGNDNRRCRGDQCRGSFSPGPFDRSPVDVHDNCISLDCGGSQKKDQPPPEQEPQSVACLVPAPFHCDQKPEQLFPPSPAGIRDFVVSTVKSGIELGRVFSDVTITFVENLMVGLA